MVVEDGGRRVRPGVHGVPVVVVAATVVVPRRLTPHLDGVAAGAENVLG